MGLWKRGRRYWTQTVVNGVWIRRPLCPPGSTRATTNWQEAVRLEKELIRAALQGSLPTQGHSIKLFAAVDDYLKAKKATANTQRAIEFDRERLEVVKRVLGRRSTVGNHRASDRGLPGEAAARGRGQPHGQHGHRCPAPGVEALQAVAAARGRREDAHRVRGRADRPGVDQRRTGTAAQDGRGQSGMGARVVRRTARGEHVNARRRSEARTRGRTSIAEKRVIHIRTSKNETSKRVIPLNDSAFDAVQRMVARADELGHSEPEHYLWCASQHHKLDPTKPASKWDTAWRALRDAGRATWPAVPRPASHGRHPAPRGRRTGSRGRIDHRTPLATDAGALFAHPAEGEEGRARSA